MKSADDNPEDYRPIDWTKEARCFHCGKRRVRDAFVIKSILGGPTKVLVCNNKYLNDCN